MRYLLDTHAYLWALAGDAKLSQRAADVFLDQAADLVLSVASVWEIAIKVSLGKLRLEASVEDVVVREREAQGIGLLAIDVRHAAAVETLPMHHRDPFDRLLAAQALEEDLAVLSRDPAFDDYGVQRVW